MSYHHRIGLIFFVVLAAFILSIMALKGPLNSYVPNCPVTFGFCMERR